MDKSPDAFRTISEVAEDLDLPQHVLRFWETRFAQIKPLKRGGGRRYYRPDDVELLRSIRHLLYGEGYTIRGVQRLLKEQGPKGVAQIASGAEPPVRTAMLSSSGRAEPSVAPSVPPVRGLFDTASEPAPLPSIAMAKPGPATMAPGEDLTPVRSGGGVADRRDTLDEDEHAGHEPLQEDSSMQPYSPHVRLPGNRLSADTLQRLQAALFEIEECRRILEEVR